MLISTKTTISHNSFLEELKSQYKMDKLTVLQSQINAGIHNYQWDNYSVICFSSSTQQCNGTDTAWNNLQTNEIMYSRVT